MMFASDHTDTRSSKQSDGGLCKDKLPPIRAGFFPATDGRLNYLLGLTESGAVWPPYFIGLHF